MNTRLFYLKKKSGNNLISNILNEAIITFS